MAAAGADFFCRPRFFAGLRQTARAKALLPENKRIILIVLRFENTGICL
jgi:hypothetical protein